MVFKKISRNFVFPNEHPDYQSSKNRTATLMNLADIYQKIETHKKLVDDFGKQIGRSQTLLKWAPAIHETEKLKNKRKEQEFKEIDSKDLERDYHFNRYLQKKYFIKNFGEIHINFYSNIDFSPSSYPGFQKKSPFFERRFQRKDNQNDVLNIILLNLSF